MKQETVTAALKAPRDAIKYSVPILMATPPPHDGAWALGILLFCLLRICHVPFLDFKTALLVVISCASLT